MQISLKTLAHPPLAAGGCICGGVAEATRLLPSPRPSGDVTFGGRHGQSVSLTDVGQQGSRLRYRDVRASRQLLGEVRVHHPQQRESVDRPSVFGARRT